MRKVLLLGTILMMATNVWAFGGIGLGPLQRHKSSSGVDAIGVHIDSTGKKANINFTDGGEVPTKPNCVTPLVLNEATNECECPSAQQCGDVCCGEGNMCNTATGQCCRQEYDGSMGECCEASLPGYSTNDGGCCGDGTIPYISYYSVEERMDDTSCCAPDKVYRVYDYDWYDYNYEDGLYRYYEQGCCEDTIYPGVGYKGWNVCCDHEPVDYTNNKGETFKVCWTNDTECTTNEQCGEGYYCNIKNEENFSCNYPASGTCEAIGGSTPADNITGLGNVIMSNDAMSWWAAGNWCKAQGKRLANVEEINCYFSGTNNPFEEGTKVSGLCCKGNGTECDSWEGHWNWSARTMDDTEGNYSPVIVDLAKAYGNSEWVWTATDFASGNSCGAFGFDFNSALVGDGTRHDGRYGYGGRALCVGE